MNRKILGTLVALASFALIAFRVVEPRLGLLAGGMVMFLIAGSPSGWFHKFVDTMGKTDFLKVILPVFAFTSVAKLTGCTDAFVSLLAAPLSKWGLVLVPVTVLAAFVTNMALVSATASGLAVGAFFLPILIASGIDPSLAIASVVAGTWGAVLSPGSKHAALIARASNESSRKLGESSHAKAMDIVRGHAWVVLTVLAVLMSLMWLEAKVLPGSPVSIQAMSTSAFGGIAWLQAMVPVLPLALLWILPRVRNEKITRWFSTDLLVFQTMLVGIATAAFVGLIKTISTFGLAVAIPRGSTVEAHGTKLADAIFSGNGMAYAYGAVMAMIIAATVFVAGLESVGVLEAFLSMLKRRHNHAAWFAFFGNAGFAALSGSGDAASCSFNLGVTPLANELGERPRELGSMAWLGAEMGRCLSPVAVVTITVTALATTLVQATNPQALKIQATHVVFWTAVPILLAGAASVLLRRSIKA